MSEVNVGDVLTFKRRHPDTRYVVVECREYVRMQTMNVDRTTYWSDLTSAVNCMVVCSDIDNFDAGDVVRLSVNQIVCEAPQDIVFVYASITIRRLYAGSDGCDESFETQTP